VRVWTREVAQSAESGRSLAAVQDRLGGAEMGPERGANRTTNKELLSIQHHNQSNKTTTVHH